MRNSIRFEVFKRDRFTCVYCGKTPPSVILECDHVIPSSKGGEDIMDNLVTACFECNRGKAARSLDDVPKVLLGGLDERKERLLQMKAKMELVKEERDFEEACVDQIAQQWMTSGGLDSLCRESVTLIRRFIRKLSMEEMMQAAETSTRVFGKSEYRQQRYVATVLWNLLRAKNEPQNEQAIH